MSLVDSQAPLCLPRLPLTRAPATPLPQGTIDTHFHVFRSDAPLNTPRSYTPDIATTADWIAFANRLGISRGIVVQPSVYGLDNQVLVEALAAFPDRLRGIVVIDPETDPTEIARLDRLGVRGVRINTRNKGGLPLIAAETLAADIRDFGWSLQLQISPDQIDDLAGRLPHLGVRFVIDHLGFIPLADGAWRQHLPALQRLADNPGGYIKLTAPYRLTRERGYAGFAEVVRALAASHPDKLLWGSDWPHTELWSDMPDDAELIDGMQDAIGNPELARKIFIENAETLFFGR
ncbi:amidohydrolase family protein [Rhizobium sp. 1399]|jgi:predicted TIM-barrel fold metal-dependent hydrolase|uniref:amidohydrolase family protein n=1 Tax=Rhizobium sp. 1399 TaxID=2817758 RepID=UPI002855F3D7|nr:amidohydrolase family protein [Rhizobium sp. 1399]MDR6666108.1 putative TIM-barrel fold metal-dependent hydrolase [Rhizobium sp. 1399]